MPAAVLLAVVWMLYWSGVHSWLHVNCGLQRSHIKARHSTAHDPCHSVQAALHKHQTLCAQALHKHRTL